MAVTPYLQGVSENYSLQRVYPKHNIATGFRPHTPRSHYSEKKLLNSVRIHVNLPKLQIASMNLVAKLRRH